MLEAKLSESAVLKKIVGSIQDLFSDVQFEFSSGGMSLQAMESSHVVLVMLLMRSEGFESYRCDRTMPVGINMGSLGKIIKCAGNDDSITLKADDGGETINFVFESKSNLALGCGSWADVVDNERVSDYDLKLMDLDVECLGVDDIDADCSIVMPSEELQRVCRDLSNISESGRLPCVSSSPSRPVPS